LYLIYVFYASSPISFQLHPSVLGEREVALDARVELLRRLLAFAETPACATLPQNGRKAMRTLLTLAIYVVPFLVIGIAARLWMLRRGVSLSDVQAQGDPHRKRSRFLLGIWRHEGRD
jgi:hypothetical protein